MRLRDALGRATEYHLRALPPTVVGLGLVGAGVWYGLDGGAASAVTTARLATAAALAAVGVAVTAVGRTAVRLDATASAVEDRIDGSGVDEDDLRETVALAAERAVADSVDGATAEITARVVEAVEETAGSGPAANGGANAPGEPTEGEPPGPRADVLDARSEESDALADATRRASERVESYLDADAADDVGEFRQLAEGAAVLDEGESAGDDDADRAVVRTDRPTEAATDDDFETTTGGEDSGAQADGTPVGETPVTGDGAEILDDDPDDPDLPDGGGTDDAEILDGDTEMVFGSDVRDPEES